jgi:hypothetical protein
MLSKIKILIIQFLLKSYEMDKMTYSLASQDKDVIL